MSKQSKWKSIKKKRRRKGEGITPNSNRNPKRKKICYKVLSAKEQETDFLTDLKFLEISNKLAITTMPDPFAGVFRIQIETNSPGTAKLLEQSFQNGFMSYNWKGLLHKI